MMACGLAVVSKGWGPQRYSRVADQRRGPIRARLEHDSILDTNGCANGRIPAFSVSNRGDLLYLVPKRDSAAGRGMVGVDIPSEIKRKFEIHEWRNALAILSVAHPDEWKDIATVLRAFHLLRSHVLAPGGRKSRIAYELDGLFSTLDGLKRDSTLRLQLMKRSMRRLPIKLTVIRTALHLRSNGIIRTRFLTEI